jgi:hypothetical protein
MHGVYFVLISSTKLSFFIVLFCFWKIRSFIGKVNGDMKGFYKVFGQIVHL